MTAFEEVIQNALVIVTVDLGDSKRAIPIIRWHMERMKHLRKRLMDEGKNQLGEWLN